MYCRRSKEEEVYRADVLERIRTGGIERRRCMVHRWASTSISISAISDIDICYSHIGDKYFGLKNVIPNIGSVPISTSEFIPISDIEENKIFLPADSNPRPLER